MPTVISLYNGALRLLGERRLSTLTDDREARYLLDDAYGDGQTEGAVKHCLEVGQWTFATRSVMLDYSPSITPGFGFTYAFDKPTDMVDVCGIWSDDRMTTPLLQYRDERHFWYAELETIYVSYVSNDVNYGADRSLWPDTFSKLIEAYLAREIVTNLTQGETKTEMARKAWKEALTVARSGDAMRKPTAKLPDGTWSLARRSYSGGSRSSTGV